jgi:hypothetical protein
MIGDDMNKENAEFPELYAIAEITCLHGSENLRNKLNEVCNCDEVGSMINYYAQGKSELLIISEAVDEMSHSKIDTFLKYFRYIDSNGEFG